MDEQQIKNILEAILMSAGKPLSAEKLLQHFDEDDPRPSITTIRNLINDLQNDCKGRGIELREVSSGFRFQARKDYGKWVSKLWEEKPQRYSRALLETLSLIAYRQPVTRADIEDVRGVSVSTSIVRTLLEREWVRVVGHRDVPGRPALFATTKQFLDYFNMKSLDELPSLSEIKDLSKLDPELDLEGADNSIDNDADSAGDDENPSEKATAEEIEDNPENNPEVDTDAASGSEDASEIDAELIKQNDDESSTNE